MLMSIPGGIIAALSAGVVALSDGNLVVQMGMQIVQTIAQAAGQTLFTPIGYIMATLIYYDLRIRKEAFDLQQRLPQAEMPQYPPQGSPYPPQNPQYPPQAPQYPPYPQQAPPYSPQIPSPPQTPPSQ